MTNVFTLSAMRTEVAKQFKLSLSLPPHELCCKINGIEMTHGEFLAYKVGEIDTSHIDYMLHLISENNRVHGLQIIKAFPCAVVDLIRKVASRRQEECEQVEQYNEAFKNFAEAQPLIQLNHALNYDVGLFPLALELADGTYHWVLIVVDFPNKKVKGYDSLKDYVQTDDLKAIVNYLMTQHLLQKRLNPNLPAIPKFRLNSKPSGVPQQTNETDCGFFVIEMAMRIARREALNFTQADIPFIKQKLAYFTIQKKILLLKSYSNQNSSTGK